MIWCGSSLLREVEVFLTRLPCQINLWMVIPTSLNCPIWILPDVALIVLPQGWRRVVTNYIYLAIHRLYLGFVHIAPCLAFVHPESLWEQKWAARTALDKDMDNHHIPGLHLLDFLAICFPVSSSSTQLTNGISIETHHTGSSLQGCFGMLYTQAVFWAQYWLGAQGMWYMWGQRSATLMSFCFCTVHTLHCSLTQCSCDIDVYIVCWLLLPLSGSQLLPMVPGWVCRSFGEPRTAISHWQVNGIDSRIMMNVGETWVILHKVSQGWLNVPYPF